MSASGNAGALRTRQAPERPPAEPDTPAAEPPARSKRRTPRPLLEAPPEEDPYAKYDIKQILCLHAASVEPQIAHIADGMALACLIAAGGSAFLAVVNLFVASVRGTPHTTWPIAAALFLSGAFLVLARSFQQKSGAWRKILKSFLSTITAIVGLGCAAAFVFLMASFMDKRHLLPLRLDWREQAMVLTLTGSAFVACNLLYHRLEALLFVHENLGKGSGLPSSTLWEVRRRVREGLSVVTRPAVLGRVGAGIVLAGLALGMAVQGRFVLCSPLLLCAAVPLIISGVRTIGQQKAVLDACADMVSGRRPLRFSDIRALTAVPIAELVPIISRIRNSSLLPEWCFQARGRREEEEPSDEEEEKEEGKDEEEEKEKGEGEEED